MLTLSPVIQLQGVTRKNGNFSIHADGEFTPGIHLLTGRVGSGKTTIGELLAGIEKPDGGEVLWNGNRRVMLLQDTSYHISTMTVREEASSWHGNVDQIISCAGLEEKEDTDIFSLSRGELKRLELAAILTGGFDLIILDEPYAGLDPDARQWVNELISSHINRIVVIISHDITSLPTISRLWQMENGNLSCIGLIPEGLKDWKRPPPLIRYLIAHGCFPKGLSRKDLEEAVCRIHG